MSIRPFKNQDYNELKDQYDSDNLFEDPEFPANGNSIYHTQDFARQLSRSFSRGISWKRPTVRTFNLKRSLSIIHNKINFFLN